MNRRIRIALTLCLAAVTTLLAGCASTTQVNPAAYLPPPGQSNIYVLRVEGMAMTSLAMIRINGNNIGGIGPSSYIKMTVPPGSYKVTSTLANSDSTRINARPGKSYYVMVTTSPGFGGPGVSNSLITDGSGPSAVANCNRVN